MNDHIKQRLRDLAFVNAFISVVDDRCVVIENVRSITECSDILANIEASGYIVRVWGSELTLSSFENSIIEVSGCISSIELEKAARVQRK